MSLRCSPPAGCSQNVLAVVRIQDPGLGLRLQDPGFRLQRFLGTTFGMHGLLVQCEQFRILLLKALSA